MSPNVPGITSGDRPFGAHSLYGLPTLQDVNPQETSRFSSAWVLGNINRSDGCVPPCTDPSSFTEVSPIQISRDYVSVRLPTVRSLDLAFGLHQSDENSFNFPASSRASLAEAHLHINLLDMIAVQNVLSHFIHQLSHKDVLVMSDNTTVVSYINRQGGTRSHSLLQIVRVMLLWAHDHQLTLRARHIPGNRNVLAD